MPHIRASAHTFSHILHESMIQSEATSLFGTLTHSAHS